MLIVDCDAPQWSIIALREREPEVLERNDRYKFMMLRPFKHTGHRRTENPKPNQHPNPRHSADGSKTIVLKIFNISDLLLFGI